MPEVLLSPLMGSTLASSGSVLELAGTDSDMEEASGSFKQKPPLSTPFYCMYAAQPGPVQCFWAHVGGLQNHSWKSKVSIPMAVLCSWPMVSAVHPQSNNEAISCNQHLQITHIHFVPAKPLLRMPFRDTYLSQYPGTMVACVKETKKLFLWNCLQLLSTGGSNWLIAY